MSNHFLDTSIEYLKGVGPKRGELLKKELSIFTFGDLLSFYPFRYVDRSEFHKITEIRSDLPYIQLKGTIISMNTIGERRGKRLVALFQDKTGMIELVWFQGIRWIQTAIKTGKEYILFGKPNFYKGKINITHPELNPVADESGEWDMTLQPVYSSTEKLSAKWLNSRGVAKLQQTLINQIHGKIPETLSDELLEKLKLLSKEEALINIHFPVNQQLQKKAEFRLKFEELFFIQLQLLQLKLTRNEKFKGFVFTKVGDYFNRFYKENLPFELTNAQKKVVKEIRKDLGSGKQMNRLLQGDVGSGKTIVALMTILIALDNGFQAALMAPTEILAHQHYETITNLLKGLDISVGLLTGSTKTAERKIIRKQLESGEMQLLTGTHALIEEAVQFKNLGLAVIDEQHRFGVAQRAKLWKKSKDQEGASLPHVLVMTATPIPRTLAMTFYGEFYVTVNEELPPGRKPIKTVHRFDSSRLRVFGFMKEQIKKGRQIYVVYPLIKESETMDYKDLMDGHESITRAFPKHQIGIVHGQMKSDVKDEEMQKFIQKKTQILIATTVIEVGVDVSNASVMVIESAERFGLSQLHQLRGRVGRGADQSYCILMTGYKLTADAKMRMSTMTRTNDGFDIAEVDLKLRGPGDLMGTQQSGILNLQIANLAQDGQILQLARDIATTLLKDDPLLEKSINHRMLQELKMLSKNSHNWGRIS